MLCEHNEPVNVNPQADPGDHDRNFCLSESIPCHELSLLESPHISAILNVIIMLKVLMSESPVWSERLLSESHGLPGCPWGFI